MSTQTSPPAMATRRTPLTRLHAADPRWTIFWSEALRNARRMSRDHAVGAARQSVVTNRMR
jgi:hypothetical protein